MTFETFSAILSDEGMTDEGIKRVWDARPLNFDGELEYELVEHLLRQSAQDSKQIHPEYFRENQ